VPLNWSAYEDIAEFFSVDVKTIDGKPIYGHMDYGKKDPSLGWRFTDAWLSMAGAADIGIPNGMPIDEWGIRVADDKCTPVGAAVSRGGATNSPAAVYALTKYIDWMKKYAPEGSHGHDLRRVRPGARARADRPADLLVHGLHRRHDQEGPAGGERRRLAQVAHGAGPERSVLEAGHAERLPGRGSWSFFKGHDANKTAAAWLYAQFITAKSDLAQEVHHRPDPDTRVTSVRRRLDRQAPTSSAGLIEFYRSPARVAWTPTGTNVPDYPKLAQLWWKNVAEAVTGEKTPQKAMDNLADEMDNVMARLERAGMAHCAPKLAAKGDPNKWLSDDHAPWKKLANEKPKGETIDYSKLLTAWKEGKVR
jgi:glycerol transport system substrate-binding protein